MKPWHDDALAGIRQGLVRGAVVLAIALPSVAVWRHLHPPAAPPRPTALAAPAPSAEQVRARQALLAARATQVGQALAGTPASDPVRQVARWAAGTGDHGRMPFAVIDKSGARIYVFDAGGAMVGTSRILLGAAVGDLSVPGIGQRPIADVRPEERTTPAGRFVAEPGRNATGERVVWVDYDAAVSMHSVRLTNPKERRLQRLASDSARERRISYGCINVPQDFFARVVWPTLGGNRSVVYVLPEQLPLATVFPGAAVAARVASVTPPT